MPSMSVATTLLLSALGLVILAGGLRYGDAIGRLLFASEVSRSAQANYCGSGARCATDEAGAYQGDTTAYLEPTHRSTTASAEPTGARPPKSTLSYGTKTVTGVLGTFCWQSDTVGTCLDAAGVPVPDETKTLSVPAGAVMVFDYGGRSLNAMRAAAYPLRREEQVGEEARTLRRLRNTERTEILAELTAGEYVVEVFVRVPEGDASYYFRIAWEEDERRLPDFGCPGY